jgi:hypothetical protein
MKHRQHILYTTALLLAVAVVGCQESAPPASQWTGETAGTIGGLKAPECAVLDADANVMYISNMEKVGDYWEDDGHGFITLLDGRGKVKKLRWLEKTSAGPLHSPKGMCLLGGDLYIADNTRVVVYTLASGKARTIAVPGAKMLNDMASDGKFAYVSDTGAGTIHRLAATPVALKAPKGANGLTFHKGRMFCASWNEHEVYEIDPTGKAEPKPFGLASRFGGLDGIEVLDDGTFIVTDPKNGEVCAIAPDRKTVTTLCKDKTPADFCVDRRRMILYVPKFETNDAAIVELKKK